MNANIDNLLDSIVRGEMMARAAVGASQSLLNPCLNYSDQLD
jgi:hypothetical protein